LLADVGHYDVYFEKKSQKLSTDPEIMGKLIANLQIGGHAILDYRADDRIGLVKEQLDIRYDGMNYPYGDGRMRIHHKLGNVRGTERIIPFNKLFSEVVDLRNGGSLGVDDKALNFFKGGYESNLMKLRKLYEAIPQDSEEKPSIRAEIKKELYDTEMDKSRVLDSTENLWKQMESLKKKRLFELGTEEEFVGRAVNPTEQQLKNFREEGRKIFEKVFPDWV